VRLSTIVTDQWVYYKLLFLVQKNNLSLLIHTNNADNWNTL